MLHSYQGVWPDIGGEVFIAPGAHIIGKVRIGSGASIWYNTVVRGDVAQIVIGENTNIQDNSTVHGNLDVPVYIGGNCTIGHGSILHGCLIQEGAFIGIGSIILREASIGEGSMVGAGSLVTQRTVIPPGTLALGRPAKVVRELTEEEREQFRTWYRFYRERARNYLAESRGV